MTKASNGEGSNANLSPVCSILWGAGEASIEASTQFGQN